MGELYDAGDLFTVIDPRGVIVTCSRSQWICHISDSHPEVESAVKVIESTIVAPDYIYESEQYKSRDVYFKSSGTEQTDKDTDTEQMKVIVEVSGNLGEVITAFWSGGVKGNINKEILKYVRPELR